MKYRRLTNNELEELELEFKQFLVSNDLSSEEWDTLNSNNPDKALYLVEMFSDIILEKALKSIKFVEYITPKGVKSFFCDKEEIVLIGITSNDNDLDFTKSSPKELTAKKLNIFKKSKPYKKEREVEVFELLQSGCSIINEEHYRKLELAYTYSTAQSKN